MNRLTENTYNSLALKDQPMLKLWRYAGLILTYKCPAACEFCYYNCSAQSNGLMPIETALSAWQSLDQLTSGRTRIHITGGEPFLYFDHLAGLVAEAKRLKLTAPHTIETNAFWATDRKTVIDRLKLLDNAGMNRLKISWDPFHAEFIDIEPVKLLAETAAEILGPQRILVRWNKYLQQPVKIKGLSRRKRLEKYKSAMRDYPVMFLGRAAGQPAELLAAKKPELLAAVNCKQAFLAAKGIHIDPYGNIFSGQCSGIIIANVNQTPPETAWKQFDPEKRDFVRTLFSTGPAGLLAQATAAGYKTRQLYADKCHLCTDIRQFFFDIGEYKPIIGPCDCYGRIKQDVFRSSFSG